MGRTTLMWDRHITPGPQDQSRWTRDWTHNLHICPDQESNQQPFGYGTMLQSTEPHWLGPGKFLNDLGFASEPRRTVGQLHNWCQEKAGDGWRADHPASHEKERGVFHAQAECDPEWQYLPGHYLENQRLRLRGDWQLGAVYCSNLPTTSKINTGGTTL